MYHALMRNKKPQIAISEGLHKPKSFLSLKIVSKLTIFSYIACKRIHREFLRRNLDDVYIYIYIYICMYIFMSFQFFTFFKESNHSSA